MMEELDASDVRKILNGDYVPKRPAKQMHTRFKGRRDATKYGKRHIPGQMNQTETDYAATLQGRADIAVWWFEAYTFKLAQDCRYTPDFCILFTDGSMHFIDAKGGGPIDDKSIVKIKAAAEKFPQFTFAIEKRQPKKLGGGWKRTEY